MKRFALSLSVVILSAACAFAGVQDFGKFTVDVPSGWTASQEDSTVIITKNDNTAAVSITVDATEGVAPKDIADAFSEAFNGTTPKSDSEGVYEFSFVQNGVESNCLITADGDSYVLLVMTGIENAPDDMTAILSSITKK